MSAGHSNGCQRLPLKGTIAPVLYFCYYTHQAPANDTIMGIVRRGLTIFQSTKKDAQVKYQASFLL
jgi:hypothetical protein